ncbi:bifunctional adenosylcobinamide kinase/adenosylcobinamide-phosphate guanylyltransferase [Rhodopseudomonas palustris]|uniref:Bifunctional adenosylcobalamin biosynthesis protein n=1 Tax=Rhodopseudomonas palustris (strain BisB18) TaxID=316056 RepID=Q210A4_RHOPB
MDRHAREDRSLDARSPAALRPTLVLGGARSGKSLYAEQLIVDSGLERIYLATGSASDDEMAARIAHHRTQRGDGWTTVEEPQAVVETLAREAGCGRAVLVDCLTLWLANLMYAGRDVAVASRALADHLRDAREAIVLVSNEVGLGLVPDTPLGRDFRDAQGRLNQIVAAAVPNVVFIAAGLPLWLKRTTAGEPFA